MIWAKEKDENAPHFASPNKIKKAQTQYCIAFELFSCREDVTEFEPISARFGIHSGISDAISSLLKSSIHGGLLKGNEQFDVAFYLK